MTIINAVPAFSYQHSSGEPEVFIPSIRAIWTKDGTILPSTSVRAFGNTPITSINLPIDLVHRIQKISAKKLQLQKEEAQLLGEHRSILNTKAGF